MTGLWDSPITPELLVSGAIGISEVVVDGADVYWAENRPSEGGRAAIVRWREGDVEEITGPDVNVRTRVHEYGGGAWWVENGRLVYSDDARQGELFLLDVASGEEVQLTSSGHRYADGRFTPDGRWFVCVEEVHRGEEHVSVENRLVAVATDGSGDDPLVVSSGHDFYRSPRPSTDGRLAFIAWDHPNMPWDSTLLHVGPLDLSSDVSGPFDEVRSSGESIVLPDWAADGRLLAVSDRSDWWNLVEVDLESGKQTAVVEGEFEIATPGWVFGLSRWCETRDGFVVVAGSPEGDTIGFPSGFVEDRHTSVTSIRRLGEKRIAYAASSFGEESAVWIHDGDVAERISTPRDLGLDDAFFPPPEHVTFDIGSVDATAPGGSVAHALYYAPANPKLVSPPTKNVGERTNSGEEEGLPPLLVMVHGGPTSAARRQLSLAIRFWTSRGVAVADVDYRGSTLYGRDFRNQLRGQWGTADVVDCVAAARYLADSGRVDPDRMVIAGGSAGGLTVLNALAHHDVFSGGICRYGVTDLASLATDTHKFEARYLDSLVGAWPDAQQTYADRSPINHADKISAPMLVLQGEDDKVVPPSQSEAIVGTLRKRNVPVTYITFAGEGHGFRRSETIVAALQAELEFVASL